MRETGWSPIYHGRGFLRRVVPSEILLLQREIADDNVAHNGEVYVTSGSSESTSTGPCGTLTLEDRIRDMITPWEVDPKQLTMHT